MEEVICILTELHFAPADFLAENGNEHGNFMLVFIIVIIITIIITTTTKDWPTSVLENAPSNFLNFYALEFAPSHFCLTSSYNAIFLT